jgi:hypothetical protein
MNIFISHIHEDFEIALAIKAELKRCFGAQVDLFLAEDIPLGSNWFENIRNALISADLILALFSPSSMERPWINIEAGYGIMANKRVIPICCLGLQKLDLPVVYVLQQAMCVDDMIDVNKLLEEIARNTSAQSLLVDKTKAIDSWRASVLAAFQPSAPPPLKQQTIQINLETYFHIVNKASGGCLDIKGWGKNDGVSIIQYPFHGGDNQLWQIKQVEHPYYCISSKHSKKCLEVRDSSDDEGAAIHQRDYEGQANQLWDFTMLQDKSYKIEAKHSGKCLSIQDTDRSYQSPVIQSSWHDLPGQRWWLKVSLTPL